MNPHLACCWRCIACFRMCVVTVRATVFVDGVVRLFFCQCCSVPLSFVMRADTRTHKSTHADTTHVSCTENSAPTAPIRIFPVEALGPLLVHPDRRCRACHVTRERRRYRVVYFAMNQNFAIRVFRSLTARMRTHTACSPVALGASSPLSQAASPAVAGRSRCHGFSKKHATK